jgi:outer membrane protein OmpA-like peptidoglycan-associated protein/ABC-type nitrate/sulfonate/bicarbonate transport system substrate-binding protein
MNSHSKIALVVLLFGAIGILGYWYRDKTTVENAFVASSDAGNTQQRIRIGVDSWVGYYPLCSGILKKRLREIGYSLECTDDKADMASRMKKLAAGELEFAVATADSYVVAGQSDRYPGVVVSVIYESKGGDAIIARTKKIDSLDALKQGQPKVAFTPNSPSEYFAKSLSVHFDVQTLGKGKNWRVETSGSAAALKALRDGSVDVAVLWEPDVSRALSDQTFRRLVGTEQTQRLIVDVLLAQRDLVARNPKLIKDFLQQYFRVLKQYREDVSLLSNELSQFTGVNREGADKMVAGVAWASLSENSEIWLAHDANVSSQEALVTTFESVISVLRAYGDLTTNPLPDADPYRLINSSFAHELYKESFNPHFDQATQSKSDGVPSHPVLSEAQWLHLKEVGTLKLRQINFSSGSDALSITDKERLDEIAESLSHYPAFYVEVRGHSGVRGDLEENRNLSQDRAEAVMRYLTLTHAIPENRIRAVGFGGTRPLVREPNESERAYGYRLPRVELTLLAQEL